MQPIRLPTIPELVARAMTGTRFLAEIAARAPHDLRCCAEIAAELAAEQWEAETGAPVAGTVPQDLTIQVAASLIAHGERHHGPVEIALYASEVQVQRAITALDAAGVALRDTLALLEAEIDCVERAKASRRRPVAAAKTIAQIHVASGVRFQTLAAVESTDGMTLLSTFGAADGCGDTELHIPAAARAWLAGVVGRASHA